MLHLIVARQSLKRKQAHVKLCENTQEIIPLPVRTVPTFGGLPQPGSATPNAVGGDS